MSNSILYSDFNCPFCYALGERLSSIQGAEKVRWRGVQHAPELPIPMTPALGWPAQELDREVAMIRTLAPEIPIALPLGKPNTKPAIVAVAAAFDAAPQLADKFKELLYRALWVRGLDISSPEVLDQVAREAGLAGMPTSPQADETTASWQQAWADTYLGGVPTIVRGDGHPLVGLQPLDRLREFLEATPINKKEDP